MNNIIKGGTIILNRDDKYFSYLKKRQNLKNLKIITFGKSKKSDVYPISIKKNKIKKILTFKVKNQILKLEIQNINIYNILSSLALLKELKLNLGKIINYIKKCEPSEGRGKVHNIKRYKKKF